ncbi:CRTAC1 family protein [Flavilitoribacter nigricans]|uniref:RNA-binding protein n=1 Tax=Flavilitoribacter nigricans (strain ATCC 23147 / DSM 23189 / NBRC 102662 / NCIMB 1420 / SS-2) TaxID=1122177 RepID=A0A2D0NE69_FLAN2|nr:CRTAC1 family protein [Flavilitoribacter nigricans]PHN06792.1 RNA-binding protein [Flavilitoribacter nigricans DSM 23189 = NBRC 102662]
MMKIRSNAFLFTLVVCCYLRTLPLSGQHNGTLFQLLPAAETGIDFNNQLFESDTLNILNQANLYNGGGVGVGDFNRDGLMDLYFAANMVSNKLYLNQGELKFQDITDRAGVDGQGRWCTGVAVVDINTDGWPDLYVSASFRSDAERRTNLLYLNQGLDAHGVPIFKQSASEYGLDDTGFSTQAYFFDYDLDGDLDLYQVTNEIYDPRTPIRYRSKLTDGSAKNTDRLYRNNGNGSFTDVSREAGINIEGWGHAASITDINMDGWPDIYVANDFISNDLCYINNQDGTFTDQLGVYFKHTAWNAMGTDIVDINNDGYSDLISLEMLPENNLRKKRMLSGNEYYNYINNEQYGYNHQYVRNMLQLNSGPTPDGQPVFEDVGFMSGIYQTDWSWCSLVADFDHDGFRDLIITNGLPRDVTDLDYIAYGNGQSGASESYTLAMTDSLPVVKLANYAYRNTNGVLFENTARAWGLDDESFSNGGVYVDLDNDGDLEVVINNINGPAFLYENTLQDNDRYLSVRFEGPAANPDGLGATLQIYYDQGQQQFYEHYPIRGYLSTNDPRAHFAPPVKRIDSLLVRWPDGSSQQLERIKTGQTITLNHQAAGRRIEKAPADRFDATLLRNTTAEHGVRYQPVETDFADYNIQRTLPHKLSQYGPGIAVGDIDQDGLDDFYVGGSSDHPGVFFMQDANARFTADNSRFLQEEDILYEDMGVLLFDADNDADLDLYLVSGSYEIPAEHPISNDRFFLNDGKGHFARAEGALPADLTNGSCVKAADFDGDGDLDLFVGGRVVSAAYPMAPRSFLLENNNGKFTDVTERYFPELRHIGMVTDALWSDFNADGKPDLVLTGEWMPVVFLQNTGMAFRRIETGLDQRTGWWNSLTAGDFDGDGDIDYVAGNQGLNTNYTASPEEPMTILAKDMDGNGLIDPMVFCYIKGADGVRRAYPMASRDDLVSQVVSMRKKFPTYTAYGLACMDDIWSAADRGDAIQLDATEMRTSYIENRGDGRFVMSPLPLAAQEAPVYGMISRDVNGDGHLDLLLVGNDYGMDPYSGRHDAFSGLCLLGDGQGHFTEVPLQESGFFVRGDAKGLASLQTAKKEMAVIATQNQDDLLVFNENSSTRREITQWIDLQANDFSADILYRDGSRRRVEFYYGATYLSQSSRKFPINNQIKSMTITDFSGNKRKVL